RLEKTGLDKAIGQYMQITCFYPLHEKAYNRLMIIFRKLKLHKFEVNIIDKAIRAFQFPYNHSIYQFNFRFVAFVDDNVVLYYDSTKVRRWQKRKDKLL